MTEYHHTECIIYHGDIPVAIVQVRIRPLYDETFPDALTADFEVENPITLKYHHVSDEFGKKVVEQMKRDRREEFDELMLKADMNYLENTDSETDY